MSESPVLVLNAGSSSLKYQLVIPETAEVQAKGIIERIGEPGSPVADHAAAMQAMGKDLAAAGVDLDSVGLRAVGHRVVHGGPDFSEPTIIDDDVLNEIKDLIPLAPLHNPGAVSGIEAARQEFDVPHVAIFDTAFFSTLPAAAATYAIPRDLAQNYRIKRYGFHGTSHQFVSRAAAELVGRDLGELNQIVLHLGNGCSASAIRGGVAIETSMGLTPLQGLVMGTRSGDVDPGLHTFLHNELGMTRRRDRHVVEQAVRTQGDGRCQRLSRTGAAPIRRRRGGSVGIRGIRPSAQALCRRVPGTPRQA